MRKSTYVCDVCGETIETEETAGVLAKTQQVWVKKSPSERIRYDFCKTCYDNLIDYLHEHADNPEDEPDGGSDGGEGGSEGSGNNENNGEGND